MFHFIENDFRNSEYNNNRYLKNWPLVYILENGKQAYIGESTNGLSRMAQHKNNADKQLFEKVHFIYSKEFNRSVTIDYESKLIEHFAADEKFVITNGNSGIANRNYYNKEYYEANFTELWEKLYQKKLVQHTIEEIRNSDLFKYSPYKALNESQNEAVEDIFRSIEMNINQPIIVNGMPGSGKTIVAVYLFKFLKDYKDENGILKYADKRVALVVPQISLRKTLKELFKHIYGLKSSDVIGPSEVADQKYDILLVDEAHRLRQRKNITNYKSHDDNNKKLGMPIDATELDWIVHQTRCPILFYDKNQVVGPSGISNVLLEQKIHSIYSDKMITYYTLLTQMRIRGGNSYIDYVKALLNNSLVRKLEFDNYNFNIINSFDNFEKLLYELENKKGLTRMVAGFAWPWISKKDKTKRDINIENTKRMWNSRTEHWVHCKNAINEVRCIHSIQGYDLNYSFVILGPDIIYDEEHQKIVVDRSSYFDVKGKNTASDEELIEYIKNIYYVLMTRGIDGTYLYICNPELKKYMMKYIDAI